MENEVGVPRDTLFEEAYFMANYAEIGRQQLERFSRVFRSIEPYVRHRSLLDVECATGLQLRCGHGFGYLRSVGLDTSSAALDIARQSLAGTGTLARMAGDPIQDKFGVVSFIDGLAHLEYLDAVFCSICQNNWIRDGVRLNEDILLHKALFSVGGTARAAIALLQIPTGDFVGCLAHAIAPAVVHEGGPSQAP